MKKQKTFGLVLNVVFLDSNGSTHELNKEFLFGDKNNAIFALSELVKTQGFILPEFAFKFTIPEGWIVLAFDYWIE